MIAGVVACPVCGQRLASTEAACSECGAILALRVPDVSRRRLASTVGPHVDVARRRLAEAVRPHVDRLYVRTRSIVTAALTTLAQRRRTGLAVAALVITLAMLAALVAAIFSPRNVSGPSVATTTGEARATGRTAPATHASSAAEPAPRNPPAPPATPRPAAVGLQNPMALAVAATTLGAIVATVAVVSRRRRALRLSWIVNSAAVVTAFCFGLAVALLVVATLERQRMFASAVPTAGDGQSGGDAWRRQASTLKEALTVIDARLSSWESTHPADEKATRPAERDGSRAVTTSGDEVAANPSTGDTAAKPPAADILRPPRVAATNLGERVWGDIVRDWERVKRTVREFVRLD